MCFEIEVWPTNYRFIISSIENPRLLFGSAGFVGLMSCDGTVAVGLFERSNNDISGIWLVDETSWHPSKCSRWCLFASAWVDRWVFRLDLWLKLLLQTGHLWGDSSMCRILWTANVLDWQNPLPHSEHLNGFSLEWMYLEKIENQHEYKAELSLPLTTEATKALTDHSVNKLLNRCL